MGADLSVVNHQNKNIYDMTKDQQFKSELKNEYDIYLKELNRVDNHVSKDQLIHNEHIERQEKVKNTIKEQGIQVTKIINSNNTGSSTTKSNKCAGVNCSNQGVQSCKQFKDKGRIVMFCSITC